MGARRRVRIAVSIPRKNEAGRSMRRAPNNGDIDAEAEAKRRTLKYLLRRGGFLRRVLKFLMAVGRDIVSWRTHL